MVILVDAKQFLRSQPEIGRSQPKISHEKFSFYIYVQAGDIGSKPACRWKQYRKVG